MKTPEARFTSAPPPTISSPASTRHSRASSPPAPGPLRQRPRPPGPTRPTTRPGASPPAPGRARRGQVQPGPARHGPAQPGPARHGPAPPGQVQPGRDRRGRVQAGPALPGRASAGASRSFHSGAHLRERALGSRLHRRGWRVLRPSLTPRSSARILACNRPMDSDGRPTVLGFHGWIDNATPLVASVTSMVPGLTDRTVRTPTLCTQRRVKPRSVKARSS